jgi:hypothetical protein
MSDRLAARPHRSLDEQQLLRRMFWIMGTRSSVHYARTELADDLNTIDDINTIAQGFNDFVFLIIALFPRVHSVCMRDYQ